MLDASAGNAGFHIDKDLILRQDPGGPAAVLFGNELGPTLKVSSTTAHVRLVGLEITNGQRGILNLGELHLAHSLVTTNHTGYVGQSFSGFGAGMANYGTAFVRFSTISNNDDISDGGGIYSLRGTLIVDHSSISNNVSGGDGGGISNWDGVLHITHSTLSGNSSGHIGGAIVTAGTTTVLFDSTISGNSSYYTGGINVQQGGALRMSWTTIAGNAGQAFGGGLSAGVPTTILASIIAANAGPSGDCAGSLITSLGYNLIGNGDGCPFATAATDLVGSAATPIDPHLGPLEMNGGPTETMRLSSGSPAIDAAGICIGTDQRDVGRPQGAACDIGALERVT